MIWHCIRFTLKPDISVAEVETALERMRGASGRLPAVRSWVIGREFGGEYEYGAVSTITDVEGYEKMMNHPAHREIDRIGLPMVDKFVSLDITDDPDPETGAKIAAIHRRRYDEMPDITGLLADISEDPGSAAPFWRAS
ncbi:MULTISPECIES: Dabb family protein [Actinoalloteichus]|uniref:Stress responsive A/B Barrel Domain-containing protein n=1 Tax=Actinoalloteichus fjordicus TaxID=1612552 RepID=A0AAC9LDB9_9PSEU|nr:MULTISPECIES: Dabb family protein [Actinoalloteichus]APU15873.1 Stress responsive A/B Barrel Domain-containing protein [Actinoalloteichus fjordicus]APU21935.1 Stress responsive A/B Barrel Domain-containing protein [Actinoalloteichus sp. GBA129-24]